MKIVTICGMSEDKVKASLLPMTELETVEKVFLVRRSPVTMAKVESHSPPRLLNGSLFLIEVYRFFALFFICLKEKPDWIYAIYFVPHGVYAAIIGRLFHIPVIQELIGTDRPLVNKSKFYQRMLSQAERIGVRGNSSLEQLSALGISKEKFFISTSVNAIDFDLFKPDQIEKVYDLIYVGRLDQNKNIGFIIDVFSELHQKKNKIKLLIVGDGPERENLELKAENLGLKGEVCFAGSRNIKDIPNLLNQSRIFIMASAFEGLPVAMIEALSCGLPVIVPDIGDISDVAIDGYNACLIDKINKDSYVACINELLKDSRLYEVMVQGALGTREKFLNVFSLEEAKEMWQNALSK